MLFSLLLLSVLSPGLALVRRRLSRLPHQQRHQQAVQSSPLPTLQDTQLDPPDLNDKYVPDQYLNDRDAKFLTGSSLPSSVQVGELTVGSQRFLYTYVNNSGLIAAGGLVVAGFLLVAGALYLYDYFVLGSGQSYDRRQEFPIPDYDYNTYTFDASRIKRYVPT